MPRSHPTRWIAFLICGALSVFGCTSEPDGPQGETGALSLNLELGDTDINEVHWTISHPGMEDMEGDINTSAPGATASVEVFGLPPGDGYLVTLMAMATDGETECIGTEIFSIEIGEVTGVDVFLRCKGPERFGSVRVNGEFNVCAYLHKVVVSPLEIGVGYDIDVSAIAKDEEDDDIEYRWSNDLGAFGDPTAQVTTYTCGEVGTHEITITITDDGEPCEDSWTVPVECVDVDGVDCTDDVECDDENDCTQDLCTAGSCLNPNENPGATCDQDGGAVCDGDGNCVACTEKTDCGAEETCFENACVSDPDLFCDTNLCVGDTELRAECVEKFLLCLADNVDEEECVALSIAICNECNENSDCDEGFMCENFECVPDVTVEYAQDFESLDQAAEDALSADGWLSGANVFQPDGTTFIRFYGVFPTPNNTGGFAGIALDQGGDEQGAQQLVIISDYNNGDDQSAGNRVEALSFQERSLTMDDVGRTITFSFDAKRGNINDPADANCTGTPNPPCDSTAFAFIKTLDPSAGFAQTNFVPEPTTDLPDSWGRLSIELKITAGLVGQILQTGFAGTAQNFEPSGVFYDNVLVTSSVTDSGGGGGELTTNGDFETGNLDGWTLFCTENNGTCAATTAQANGGSYSGNLVASVPGGGGPASFPLMKQANIGMGTVAPNSPVTISFDLFGSLAGAGGVVFAEFFSELSGGGTSKSEILGGGPLFPNAPNDWTAGWTTYTFTTTTGPDVSGGVTLQLKADCGANAGCTVDTYWDNVSVTSP